MLPFRSLFHEFNDVPCNLEFDKCKKSCSNAITNSTGKLSKYYSTDFLPSERGKLVHYSELIYIHIAIDYLKISLDSIFARGIFTIDFLLRELKINKFRFVCSALVIIVWRERVMQFQVKNVHPVGNTCDVASGSTAP